MDKGAHSTGHKEYDIYRDSLLRYLGYANEVGEAFRPLVPKSVVHASYGLAVTYVCADVIDKAKKTYNKTNSGMQVTKTASDVFIWQMLASVMIPGFTINRITFLASRMLKQTNINKNIAKTLPTAIGLSAIPLIIHPIDHFVDFLMDNTIRKWLR